MSNDVGNNSATSVELDEATTSPRKTADLSFNGKETQSKQVYIPGISRPLKEREELVCDKSAYKMLRHFQCEYPCLSFDIVPDSLGDNRDSFPVTTTLVAGTQADNVRNNGIVLMHLSNLTRRKDKEQQEDEEEAESSSSSDSEDEQKGNIAKPVMLSCKILHHGGVNRIRVTRVSSATICASWNGQGKVQIWNLASLLKTIEDMGDGHQKQSEILKNEKPVFSFAGHQCEGYAIDWSEVSPGRLASGDNRRRIHLWQMAEGGSWSVDQRPRNDHKGSVEDIQWSPCEDNVFASCSSDSTIRLWDARVPPVQSCICTVDKAHDSDVNVISWNRKDPFLLSGGDDGAVKVWDLKAIQYKSPVAVFKHHRKPISSVHWYSFDSTVFAAASEDDQVTIWDLAVEEDEINRSTEPAVSVPPQLMFVHCGQKQIKEIRWHPQNVGLLTSTAENGFDIFRSINM